MNTIKIKCDKCNNLVRSNNFSKHTKSCTGAESLSWYMRKANNIAEDASCTKRASIMEIDWNKFQHAYDGGMSIAECCKEFKTTFTSVSKAGKLGLVKTRERSETARLRGNTTKGRMRTQEEKQRISASMKRAVAEGRQRTPRPYGVYCIEYNGVMLQSKWELKVAMHLDDHNIKWERPCIGHEYIFGGATHLYFPDFYLPDYNTYVEVKGWKQSKDDCKWRDFKHELKVVDCKSINNLSQFFEKLVLPEGFEPPTKELCLPL